MKVTVFWNVPIADGHKGTTVSKELASSIFGAEDRHSGFL
jgi:hypothetical protein